jgi:REP element-mobilizing transposase RayT
VHLLVEGCTEDADGRLFMARAKQLSGFHFRRQFGVPLWQPFGFERTLRPEECALGVARYILENPIRAGLVTHVHDYPFVGSNVYTVDEILEAIQLHPRWRNSRFTTT